MEDQRDRDNEPLEEGCRPTCSDGPSGADATWTESTAAAESLNLFDSDSYLRAARRPGVRG